MKDLIIDEGDDLPVPPDRRAVFPDILHDNFQLVKEPETETDPSMVWLDDMSRVTIACPSKLVLLMRLAIEHFETNDARYDNPVAAMLRLGCPVSFGIVNAAIRKRLDPTPSLSFEDYGFGPEPIGYTETIETYLPRIRLIAENTTGTGDPKRDRETAAKFVSAVVRAVFNDKEFDIHRAEWRLPREHIPEPQMYHSLQQFRFALTNAEVHPRRGLYAATMLMCDSLMAEYQWRPDEVVEFVDKLLTRPK